MSSRAACGRFEVDADAAFEAGDRILLADAADEGGQRRVGAARRFQGHVRRGVADVGNVERALILQLLARISGDRQRHVGDALDPAPGGDEDHLVLVGCGLRVADLRRDRLVLGVERGRGSERGGGAANLQSSDQA
jgi:hypothetical protein